MSLSVSIKIFYFKIYIFEYKDNVNQAKNKENPFNFSFPTGCLSLMGQVPLPFPAISKDPNPPKRIGILLFVWNKLFMI
jgi:hypothetical protein